MKISDIESLSSEPGHEVNGGAIIDLDEFLATTGLLTADQRRVIIDQAIFLLDDVYVHLPLKRAMHAIDPVQKLKLLRRQAGRLSERQFHNEMLELFHSMRDLHTNYVLPSPFREHTAFLPFEMGEFYDEQGERHYLVTRMLVGFEHPEFRPGVEITHWSGAPIEQAVADNADREAGSNEAARHVRGLDAMTIRPMALTLPPAAAWVIVGYLGNNVAKELRLPWQVFRPDPGEGSGLESAEIGQVETMMGLDLKLELTNRARRDLFVETSKERRDRAAEARTRSLETVGDNRFETFFAVTSMFPDTFEFESVTVGGRDLGYLRIKTFGEPNTPEFIAEVIRIINQLPQNGLIIDVRNNGGGIITNGEQMLQLFTDEAVEAERLHFINNEVTLAVARSPAFGGFANAWERSIELAEVTGAVYSQGFPIEDPAVTNAIGRRYPGPVVLITDGRCYSTTDIFAAGFQDNGLGPILGVDENTGAGGANVFRYDLLRQVLGQSDLTIPALPANTDMRIAIRRTTRVGANAGMPLEDLGVVPDKLHRMTHNDLLNGNPDLLEAAAALLPS